MVFALTIGAASALWGQDQAEEASGSDREAAARTGEGADADERPSGGARFGGPDAVDNQLRSDAEEGEPLLDRYYDWKSSLAEETGFSFGVDYSAVYLSADSSPGRDEAAGGMARFYGTWDLVGRESGNTGALVWKGEHRHAYTAVAPGSFGFELGYVGLIEPPFSDQGARLTNLYWRQRMADGNATFVGGFVDLTDYVDVYALASPWTGFMNFVFSTGGASIGVPNEGFGLAAAGMVTDRVFVIGGLADTNSDPTSPGETIDSFFGDNEYFTHLEIGWTPSRDRIYLDNAHLTLWHAAERVQAGVPDGWGVNASFTRHLAGKWLPFVRAGYAEDGGSLLEATLSAGFGYQREPGKDAVGVGLNWGRPNESTFEPSLSDQYTVEVFYRWRPTKEIGLTPDIQYIVDPALNPGQSSIWVLGIRARVHL